MRFGQASEIRRAEMESIRWMVALAARAGVQRIVLNGSFVTDIIEPNDVDCLLVISSDMPKDANADAEIKDGLPYLDIQIGGQDEFEFFATQHFSLSRERDPKGMIEVVL